MDGTIVICRNIIYEKQKPGTMAIFLGAFTGINKSGHPTTCEDDTAFTWQMVAEGSRMCPRHRGFPRCTNITVGALRRLLRKREMKYTNVQSVEIH